MIQVFEEYNQIKCTCDVSQYNDEDKCTDLVLLLFLSINNHRLPRMIELNFDHEKLNKQANVQL